MRLAIVKPNVFHLAPHSFVRELDPPRGLQLRRIGARPLTHRLEPQQREDVIIGNLMSLWNSFARPVCVKKMYSCLRNQFCAYPAEQSPRDQIGRMNDPGGSLLTNLISSRVVIKIRDRPSSLKGFHVPHQIIRMVQFK